MHDLRSPVGRQLSQCRGEVVGLEHSPGPQRDGGDRDVVAVGAGGGVGDAHVDCVQDAECVFDGGPADHPVGGGDERVGAACEPEVAVLIAVEQVSGAQPGVSRSEQTPMWACRGRHSRLDPREQHPDFPGPALLGGTVGAKG